MPGPEEGFHAAADRGVPGRGSFHSRIGRGRPRPIAADIDDGKLAFARSLGADAIVNATRDDPADAVRAATAGGAHVSFDALGSKTTALNAIRSLRRRGRHVQAGLLYDENASLPLPLELAIAWELDIVGSRGMPAAAYPALLTMANRGLVRPARLVTERVSLERACEILPAMGGYTTQGVVVIDRF